MWLAGQRIREGSNEAESFWNSPWCLALGAVVFVLTVSLGLGLGLGLAPSANSAADSGMVVVQFHNNASGAQTQSTAPHGFRLAARGAVDATDRRRSKDVRILTANGPSIVPIDVEMKFLAVYLWTDYDVVHFRRVNDDPVPAIWRNPECEPFGSECETNNVTRFFNFTDSLATINAELNSQQRPIPAGTYHYVQMEMCKHHLINGSAVAGTDANFRFRGGDMNSTYATVSNNCGIWSARADPPIVVTANATVTVQLTFTLTDICVETQTQAPSQFCAAERTHQVGGSTTVNAVCCDVPHFVPSIVQ